MKAGGAAVDITCWIYWSGRRDSTPRPSAPKADALPGCATPRHRSRLYQVGCGIEACACSRCALDTRLHARGEDHERDAGEEEPGAPVTTVRLLEVLSEQGVVAAVGLPGDVEDVAEERDGADDDVQREVDQHARDGDVGCAARPCGEDDDRGGESGEDVADARDEADDAIDAEADGGSGDAEPGIEHAAEQVEIFVAEEAAADAGGGGGRENLG